MPPTTNGQIRPTSRCLRCGQSVERCNSMPQPVARTAEWIGSMRCSQMEVEASAKAKPLAPAAMPPSSAPSHKMASVSKPNCVSMRGAKPASSLHAPQVHRARLDRPEDHRLDQKPDQ